MRLLGATKVSNLNMQHVSNLFSKPVSSRFRAIVNDFLLDKYKRSRTADLRWACWLREVWNVGIVEAVGAAGKRKCP